MSVLKNITYILITFLFIINCGGSVNKIKPEPKQNDKQIQDEINKFEAKINLELIRNQALAKRKLIEELKDIEWYELSEDSLIKAKKEQKCMLLFFSAPNCYYCTEVKENTLTNAEVQKLIVENFVAIKINAEEVDVSLFNIETIPAFIFTNQDGKVLLQSNGIVPIDPMIKILNVVSKEC